MLKLEPYGLSQGVGTLFVYSATLKKSAAGEGRTLSLQIMKNYSVSK